MLIQASNIYKRYAHLEVLKGIDLLVSEGEIVSIVGASGAGKTTLLQILGTLTDPEVGGSIRIAGQELCQLSSKEKAHFRNQKMGFIFQSHQLLPEFTALENVLLPALIGGRSRSEAQLQAEQLLERLGLLKRKSHRPSELSGGECQRVAVARALINNPKVILADEPSGSLDTHSKEELHDLFFSLRKEIGQTFVIVTHDMELAQRADRMVVLKDGRIESIHTSPTTP